MLPCGPTEACRHTFSVSYANHHEQLNAVGLIP